MSKLPENPTLRIDGLTEPIRFQLLDGEDNYLGTTHLNGCGFHVELYRVTTPDDGGCQEATGDPHDRAGDVWRLLENAACTVEIFGLPGEWIVHIYPHGV